MTDNMPEPLWQPDWLIWVAQYNAARHGTKGAILEKLIEAYQNERCQTISKMYACNLMNRARKRLNKV